MLRARTKVQEHTAVSAWMNLTDTTHTGVRASACGALRHLPSLRGGLVGGLVDHEQTVAIQKLSWRAIHRLEGAHVDIARIRHSVHGARLDCQVGEAHGALREGEAWHAECTPWLGGRRDCGAAARGGGDALAGGKARVLKLHLLATDGGAHWVPGQGTGAALGSGGPARSKSRTKDTGVMRQGYRRTKVGAAWAGPASH